MPETPECYQEKMIREACERLGEHFDSVIIFATLDEPEATKNWVKQLGNYFANSGIVSDWLVKKREELKKEVRDRED